MNKTKRQSGIELLRIIVMLQIVFLHVCDHGKFAATANNIGGSVNLVADSFWALCRMPVDVFILITGYFLVTSGFDWKKIFRRTGKVYGAMIFYSVIISIVFFCTNPSLIDAPAIFRTILPVSSREWYFLTIYIIILFLSPFINMVLQQIDKKQYLILLVILFLTLSVWSTLASIKDLNLVFNIEKVLDPYGGKSLASLLMMYIIGGYIRRFTTPCKKPQMRYLLMFLLLCAADFALHMIMPDNYAKANGAFNNPLVVLQAAMIFMFFRDMNFSNSIINTIAGTTLGIYAIHENPYIRDWLWHTFSFTNEKFFGGWAYMPKILLLCLAVFAVCSVIELARLQIFAAVPIIYKKLFHKDKADNLC